MKPFSFIHAADLHLGSPFKGVGSELTTAAKMLRSATYDAFSGLIDLCIEKSVDFLLVAGDIFDLSDRSMRAQLAFRDGLSRLSKAGIRSFTVFGNHDPWEAWSRQISWPETAHIFSPDRVETIIISKEETPVAAISGISYQKRKETDDLSARFKAENQDLYQIGLLHGNCGNNPNHGAYAPCSLTTLQQSGFDYWALGHVHENKILGTHPHIIYPGCTQGLSIRETGPHGCYLVSVTTDRQATLSFQVLDRLRWQTAEISISGIETLDNLDRAIQKSLSRLCMDADERPVISRISLTGRGCLYSAIRQAAETGEILEHVRQLGEQQTPPVWVQNLVALCQPDINLSRRQAMDDLLGQILRNVSDIQAEPGNLTNRLMPALKDLYDHPKIGRYLDALSITDLEQLLQSSALLCYDLLELDR